MEILGLSTSPSSGGAYALILNESNSNRRLPIIIGTFEAQAIAMELEHIKSPRPMTHDLMRNIMQSFDAVVKYVHINDLKNGTFYATIAYDYEGQEAHQDARPSDAIALAIRFNAPIYAASKVMQEAGIVSDEENENDDPGASMDTPGRPARTTDDSGAPSSSARQSAASESPENQLQRLESRLNKAIEAEDYEKAAKIRDEIEKLKGHG